MTRAKYYFFITVLLITIILFSWEVMAADPCTCSIKDDCETWEFCDFNNQYTIPGNCNPGMYEYECYSCRAKGETCLYGDDSDCCNSRNCTGVIGNRHCCDIGEKWNTSTLTCQALPANACQVNGDSSAGDTYCSGVNSSKGKCCSTPGDGHCEACCNLADCTGFCRYCRGGAIGTWSCQNQDGTDFENECSGDFSVCNGAGGCEALEEDTTPCNPGGTGSQYACALGHTGGTPSCTCGGRCYSASGVDYYCRPTERCVTYSLDPVTDPDRPTSLHVCSTCQPSSACCVPENGVATLPSQCCAGLYLNGTHCCQPGWRWDSLSSSCVAQDPCYSALGFPTSSNYCNLFAPDIGSYGTCSLSSWLSSSPLCVDYSLSPPRTCCFVNAGIFGYAAPGSQFYYWHERIPVVVY